MADPADTSVDQADTSRTALDAAHASYRRIDAAAPFQFRVKRWTQRPDMPLSARM